MILRTSNMTKCIGSVTNWAPKLVELEDNSFIVDEVQDGERALNNRDQIVTSRLIFSIADDYASIKQSALFYEHKYDCSQMQEAVVNKLDKLYTEVASVTQLICDSSLTTFAKHRLFIVYSENTIRQLKKLLLAVGRLSELDQSFYLEEQLKPFISEHSVTIHALTTIWSATVEIMNSFRGPAKQIFENQPQIDDGDEFENFVDYLDFSTTGIHYAKILLMDLIITSCVQFERSSRLDELIKGLPFLCPCHTKLYLKIVQTASDNKSDLKLLVQMLNSILDYHNNPSMITDNARKIDILPSDSFIMHFDRETLAYFVLWHLCTLARIVNESYLPLILSCQKILENSFDIAMKQFFPKNQRVAMLSPHQQERFKLMFLLLNRWCKKSDKSQQSCLSVLKRMFLFFDNNWDIFGESYFDKVDFTVEGETIFQLFTGLLDEITMLYGTRLQVEGSSKDGVRERTREEKELYDIWDRLSDRNLKPQMQPSTKT